MNVGLIDVDTSSGWSNLPLMRISAWHKACGDSVEWYDPLFSHPDKAYSSKVFKFTDEPEYWPQCETVIGGTGHSLTNKLPLDIEQCDPDYSIYPNCNTTIQLFSRGCIRRCPWCVVPEKEGGIRAVDPMTANPRGEWVEVLDNSFFGHNGWSKSVDWLLTNGQPVSLHGVDARTVFKDEANALLQLTHQKQIHIAWDDSHVDMRPHFKRMIEYIPKSKMMCYVLIGFDSTPSDDEWRVRQIHKLGITPYVMAYDRKHPRQQRFQKWVNGHAFKTVPWKEFNNRRTAL